MDGDRPLISVIIPTFNREEHIGRCLDSVVTESFDDYQVVVVDNASTDDTAGVAGRYIDRMDLEIVVNDVNHERSFSRNRGAEIAGGRYLLFLRSEEHTSELQSRTNLVCRLLLEKKKILLHSSILSPSLYPA